MRRLLIVFFLGISAAYCGAQADTTCPIASFGSPDRPNYADLCGTGGVSIEWDFCDVDTNASGAIWAYWNADSVVWNMGDGTSLTTLGTSEVTHTYTIISNGFIFVTAMAYFTGEQGEQCSVPLYSVFDGNGDDTQACELVNDTTGTVWTTSSLTVLAHYALPSVYVSPGDLCAGDTTYIYNSGGVFPDSLYVSNEWDYELFIDGVSVATGSGVPSVDAGIYSGILDEGDHTLEIVYNFEEPTSLNTCTVSDQLLVTIDDCDTCTVCNTFKPLVGERYWISAWVKEDRTSQEKTYEKSLIRLLFTGGSGEAQFLPTGDLVEGWQRIVGSFTIPIGTSDLDIQLINRDASVDTYFDDIRIHPFNGNMKSYIYDPETLWLTAELDDNNYATFYEYDLEGQLIRIKKETARGIMTIQESRSSNPKE